MPECFSFVFLPRQGNVFTPVCDSVHRVGCLCQWGCLCPWEVSLSGGSLSRGVSVLGFLFEEVSVQGGSLYRWVSVQGGLCPGGFLSRGGGLCPGESLLGTLSRTFTCGRYASYWNAFLLCIIKV